MRLSGEVSRAVLFVALALGGCSSTPSNDHAPTGGTGSAGFGIGSGATGGSAGSAAGSAAGASGAGAGAGAGGMIATGGGSGGSAGSTGAAGSSGSAASGTGGTSGSAASGSGGSASAGIGGMSGSGMSMGGTGTAGSNAGAGSGGSDEPVDAGMPEAPEKFVGNITTRGAVRDGFNKYWNQITPENEGKWASVQPSQGTFNWGALDKIYDYAKTNHIVFKEHCFVWGNQQPGWVNNGNAETAVKAWMKAFCDRYPETKLIDVVNEPPPHTTPAYIDGMGGKGTSGYDWIVNAFKWAHAACPNAILILNDYNNIEYGDQNSHFIDIVNKIKAAGAPIDAIGAQAHAAHSIQTNTVKGYLDKLAATGLPIYITEYDIDEADDNRQKNIMQEQMTMFWNHEDIKGITLWGYIVGATWQNNSGIQKSDNTMRPAMTWLMDFLKR